MMIAYIKEAILKGLITLHRIPTQYNAADILSKPVFGADFRLKRDLVLGINNEHELNNNFNENIV
jgi:hypothetical protein